MERRTFLKWLGKWIGIAGLAGLLDAFLIEPHMMQRRDVKIEINDLPAGFDGLRIAHFSDVHVGFGLSADDFVPLIEKMNQAKPDIVVFTGDLVDHEMSELERTMEVFSALVAPYGRFAVLGNHDVRGDADPKRMVEAYRNIGFTPLVNEHVKITHPQTGEELYIAGTDSATRMPDLERAFGGIPEVACTLALIHEPDLADEAARHGASLQLSGHSHGGQVRLPFIGGLLFPIYANKYNDGMQQTETGMPVFISRGIGTTILPIRFFCPPEWHIILIKRKL